MTSEPVVTAAQGGLDAKRNAAKEIIGERWVNHPAYIFTPRHSNTPAVYGPAREAFIAQVKDLARADREANPAFIRAETIRAAFVTKE